MRVAWSITCRPKPRCSTSILSHEMSKRTLGRVEQDPEDAVTAGSSMMESACRSPLIEFELPLPPKKNDIEGLMRAVQEPLGLRPGRSDLSTEIAKDFRQILGGLTSTVLGVGALRTHGETRTVQSEERRASSRELQDLPYTRRPLPLSSSSRRGSANSKGLPRSRRLTAGGPWRLAFKMRTNPRKLKSPYTGPGQA